MTDTAVQSLPRPFKPFVVSMDLEFNQPSQRIIQIGAVIGDLRTGTVVSRFSAFVNPQEPLEPRIGSLCGITAGALEVAGTLKDAYANMLLWLGPFNSVRQMNPLTWGGGDAQALRDQLQLKDEHWSFGRRHIDVKTVFVAWQHARRGESSGGLKASMRRVKTQFVGRPHDAAADAHSTFVLYCRLLELIRGEQTLVPMPLAVGPAESTSVVC